MRNDLFARLGALDQKLYQPPAPKPAALGEQPAATTLPPPFSPPEEQIDAGKPANRQASLQVYLQTGIITKLEKYSSYLQGKYKKG